MPAFFQGSLGRPFDSIGQLMQYPPDAKTSSDASQTIFLNVSRDGAGRSRFTFRFLNGGPGEMVYVMDPVAGCFFAWNEVASWETDAKTKPAGLEAKVRCNARGVAVPVGPRWDDLNDDEKAQIAKAGADKLQFVNERVGEGKVGERYGEQVSTVKYARYAVHAGGNGKAGKRVKVAELWYSPELDMVVKVTRPPAGRAKTNGSKVKDEEPEELLVLDLNSIQVGEPPEEFYPPYGYEIKVDETLLPPFAPVPVEAAPVK